MAEWTALVSGDGRGDGEASVFAAAQLRGGIAATDDRRATQVARRHGVEVYGTIWLLAAGCRAGKLTEVNAGNLIDGFLRLSRVTGRPLQRVGLSATVGNPDELLRWLQGSGRGVRPGRVVAPDLPVTAGASASAPQRPAGDVELDFVGNVDNAAKVIAALHRGEKRLVFCESRELVEELGQKLRALGVAAFLSHSSLAVDERRRAEEAFAQERDCVIVATSTLELGIDVGDLDRVIQIDAPGTVSAFLQRLGRTGRRPGSTRNCLFLAVAERRFGRRHFMEMTSVFTAPPQFTVLSGPTEIGLIDPVLLTQEVPGPRVLLLGGRHWRVTYVDWAAGVALWNQLSPVAEHCG